MPRHACAWLLSFLLLSGGSSAQTSTWTDPSVDVEIPAGQTITVDSPVLRFRTLTNRGTLVLPDRPVRIEAACGVLNYGVIRDEASSWDRRHDWIAAWTPATAAGIVGGPNYLASDCTFWNFGRWDAKGAQVTRWWSKLAADVTPGVTAVTVEGDVSDWPVGGFVGLSMTGDGETVAVENGVNRIRSAPDESEYGTIAAVGAYDGRVTTITLTTPLTKAHAGTGLLRGELALYTRSITFKTDLAGFVPNTADPRNRLFASLIFMPKPDGDGTQITHSGGASGSLCNVAFWQMGAYGKDGRPALHLHRLGDGGRAITLCGLSFYLTAGNATNIHETNGVYVEEPVAGHHAGGAVYMQQTDTETQTADIVTVRGLSIAHSSKPFQDRAATVPGEYGRTATCYWMGVSEHEVFMGNVCAGGTPNGQDATGFHFPERNTSTNGTVRRVFLTPEAHSLTAAGVHAWQNRTVGVDMVGASLWGLGNAYRHGAYGFPVHTYNSLFARTRVGILRSAVSTLVQDSRFVGRGSSATRLISTASDNGADTGVTFSNYAIQPQPHEPNRYYRNRFEAFTPDASGNPGVAIWRANDDDPESCNPLSPLQSDTFALARYCSSAFVSIAQQTYLDGIRPMAFGSSTHARPFWPNTGSHWVDFDRGLVLVRKDMTAPEGAFAPRLVTLASFYDASADALATPLSSLPASITFTNLRSYRDRAYGPYTLDLRYDPPPTVTMAVQVTGDRVRMAGASSPDTVRLECWINEVRVLEVGGAGPYVCDVPLPQPERRWSYAWVVAYDGVTLNAGYDEGTPPNNFEPGFEQHAYADPPVVEISPEMRRTQAPPPPPVDPTLAELQQQLAITQATLATVTQERDAARQSAQQSAGQVSGLQSLITTLDARIAQLEQAIQAARNALAGVP